MKINPQIILSVLIFLICSSYSSLSAQNTFPNTLTLDTVSGSPAATLLDVAWLQGHWKGEALGGITEEVWSSPLGGAMMCVFRLIVDDEVRFYEIITISEEKKSLILRLKHFHRDLKGWEEKDETIDFPLVKLTEDRVYFDGFTFEKLNDSEMNIYVIIGDKDNRMEAKFPYKRAD